MVGTRLWVLKTRVILRCPDLWLSGWSQVMSSGICLRFMSFLQDDPSRRRLPPTAAAVAASMGTVTDVVAVISMRMTIPVTGARTVAAAWVRFAGSHAGNVIARSPDRAVTA